MFLPEADTVIIPMINSIILAVILLPIIAIVTWICLRGIDGVGNLLEWDRQRPIRSVVVTGVFGIPFCSGLLSVVDSLTAPPGWHGIWWIPYTLISLLWLVMMRGSLLTKRTVR